MLSYLNFNMVWFKNKVTVYTYRFNYIQQDAILLKDLCKTKT